jgi:hypothetical protein
MCSFWLEGVALVKIMLHQLIILVGDFRTDIIILYQVFIQVRWICTSKNKSYNMLVLVRGS